MYPDFIAKVAYTRMQYMNVIRIGKDVHLNTVFQLSCFKWTCLFKKKMQRNLFPVQSFDAWGSSLVRQHLRQEGLKVAVRSQGQVISRDTNAYIIDTIGWSSASMLEKWILNLKAAGLYTSVWVSCLKFRCDCLWALLLSIFENCNDHPCEIMSQVNSRVSILWYQWLLWEVLLSTAWLATI